MALAKMFLILATSVTTGGDIQLLCFGAKWCQPCREMQPALDQLAREGFPIRKVDVDQYGDVAKRYEVTAVPTFVLVDQQGRRIDQIAQATDYHTLKRFFAHYRVSPTATTVRGQSPETMAAARDAMPNATTTAPGRSELGSTRPAGPIGNTTPGNDVQTRSLAATVRLRVEDDEGHSFGTGTVIDVHGQEALVLTCGHIFRTSEGKGRILMERFDSQTAEPTTGTLISYDIDRDVALVSMKLTRPIEVAKLAALKTAMQPGEPVYSVGCNQGAHPTVMVGKVNQIDKYLGPPNITASGRPVVGRSGGGLFNARGELVGVCSAADPEIDEGLYAALPRVYYELDHNGLSFVYQNAEQQPIAQVASAGNIPVVPVTAVSEPSPTFPAMSPAAPIGHAATNPAPLSPSRSGPELVANPVASVSATSGISRQAKPLELVCVLKSDDGATSQAFVIENPSAELLQQLQRESKPATP